MPISSIYPRATERFLGQGGTKAKYFPRPAKIFNNLFPLPPSKVPRGPITLENWGIEDLRMEHGEAKYNTDKEETGMLTQTSRNLMVYED